MRVGTKSILYGAHAFYLHPWFVVWAWWKLYGFPWDPRLWVAFFVHDLGYWGCPNMDGNEGERHPEWGAWVMHRLFDRGLEDRWWYFTLYHSRFFAKQDGVQPSRLCIADKLAIVLTPSWLYVPMATATGEIHEYMRDFDENVDPGVEHSDDRYMWHGEVQAYVAAWVEEHRDGRPDTWTKNRDHPNQRADGVWE